MSAAFAAAIDALFADPNLGAAALWKPGGIGSVAVRVIRKQPDRVAEFGASRAVMSSTLLDLRIVEAPTLAEGDLIVIGAETLRIVAEPIVDALGLVVTGEAVKV